MTRYKVALPGNRWRYGFETLAEASAYASAIEQRWTRAPGALAYRRGSIVAVEAYKARR